MSTPQPTTTEGLRPVDEADRWWQRHVTPLLARWERDFGQQQPPPPPVAAAPGRVVGADAQEVPMLPLSKFGPRRRAS